MSDISLNAADRPSFLTANSDLAISLLVSLTGLVVNLALVTAGIMIV